MQANSSTSVPVDSSISLFFTTVSVASLVGVVFWHTFRFLSLPSHEAAEKTSSSNELTSEESNLRDQYEYTPQGESPEVWEVRSLWIFPVKSCHGIELKESRVVRTGLEYDRQYTFAEKKFDPMSRKEGWVFITQRQYPSLARVMTHFKPQKDLAGGKVLEVGYPVKTWLNRWIA